MKVLRYLIHLHQSLLVAGRGGDPNTVQSLSYIPGTTLRGALIGRYCRDRPLDITDATTRRLFFDGPGRFLNAYPVDHLNRRSLPTPLSWRRPKGETNPIHDFAVDEPAGTDWQAVGLPFFTADQEDQGFYGLTPERWMNLHTRRDRLAGRALADAGDIYNYEALSPEQTFAASVLCDTEEVAAAIRPLLEGNYRLGRAMSTYGSVVLEFVDARDAADWREQPSGETIADDPEIDCDGNRLSVTLLSDTLLRDDWGRPRVDARILAQTLVRRLGLDAEPEPEASFLGVDRRVGFNRTWGLPLPQEGLLTMGSVFVFRLKGKVPPASALTGLEWGGIGFLRAEGFGRLLCNWHQESKWTFKQAPPPGSVPASVIDSPAGKILADRMTRRLRENRLDDAMTRRVLDPASGLVMKNPPPVSQLSRLRGCVQNELLKSTPNLNCLDGFLSELRAPARRHLQRARIAGKPLENWLKEIAAVRDETGCLKCLGIEASGWPRIGNTEVQMDAVARQRALLRLVDSVLARAAKQQRVERAQ